MQSLIADVLKSWREAERLLESLSPTDPDHDMVRDLVIELRAQYAHLSESAEVPQSTIQQVRALLESAADLFGQSRGEPA